MPSRLWITINARLCPLDRGDRYEDPLRAALDARAPGSKVTGAGTLPTADREPAFSDIDLDIGGDAEATLGLASDIRTRRVVAGRPTGSVWPEFAERGKGTITIRQVLQHRSDLPNAHSLRGRRD